MIPVIDGVGIVESGVALNGGRIVIGVPAPTQERIDVRITATSLEHRSGTESQQSIVREVTEPRCRTTESQLKFHSSRFESMNEDGGVLVSLPTRRKFRFPGFQSFAGEESLGLIEGELLIAGSRSLVYVDLRDRDLPHLEGLGHEIVRLIDEELLELIESRIWPIEDLDRNGKFTLLLSSEMIRVSPSQQFAAVPLKGMTWSEDYSASGTVGNQADLVYLHPHLQADGGLRSLLLHEMAHAACFSRAFQDVRSQGKLPPDWISEGIAHLAETWRNEDRSNWELRLTAFEQSPQESPLFIDAYSRAGLWRHPGSRGAVISFFHWLARRSPEDFVHAWLANETLDERGLAEMFGEGLDELFRAWSTDRGMELSRTRSSGIETFGGDEFRSNEQSLRLRGSTFTACDIPAGTMSYRIRFPEGVEGQVTFLPCRED